MPAAIAVLPCLVFHVNWLKGYPDHGSDRGYACQMWWRPGSVTTRSCVRKSLTAVIRIALIGFQMLVQETWSGATGEPNRRPVSSECAPWAAASRSTGDRQEPGQAGRRDRQQ